MHNAVHDLAEFEVRGLQLSIGPDGLGGHNRWQGGLAATTTPLFESPSHHAQTWTCYHPSCPASTLHPVPSKFLPLLLPWCRTLAETRRELQEAISSMGIRVKFDLLHDEAPQVGPVGGEGGSLGRCEGIKG